MEENENITEVQTDETGAESGAQENGLSRDDILAASRKENKNGDEREQQTYNRALSLGYGVGMIFLAIVMLVTVCVENEVPAELYMCYSAVWATCSLYYGIKATKRRWFFLVSGIIGVMACTFFTVAWILNLCGVTI